MFSKHEFQRRYAASHVAGAQVVCSKFTDTVFQLWDEGLGNLLVQVGPGSTPKGFQGCQRIWKEIDVTQIFNFILGVIFLLCILFLGVQCRLIIYMMIYLVVHIKVDSSLSSSQSLNFKMALLLQ